MDYILNRVTEDVQEVIVKCWQEVAGTLGSGKPTSELCLPWRINGFTFLPSFPHSPPDLSVAGPRDTGGITVQWPLALCHWTLVWVKRFCWITASRMQSCDITVQWSLALCHWTLVWVKRFCWITASRMQSCTNDMTNRNVSTIAFFLLI